MMSSTSGFRDFESEGERSTIPLFVAAACTPLMHIRRSADPRRVSDGLCKSPLEGLGKL